jgi:cellulose synthase/poly-beta-1,6-N-acetylglucosamine synthase-like glycosyltransferase
MYFLNFSLSLGLHLARSEFIARMDADDVSHPERLEAQLTYMQANSDVAVLGSAYFLIDDQGCIHGKVDTHQSDFDIRRALRYGNPICHPSVMLRREAILAEGGYLGGKNAEDYDLWLRLAIGRRWRFANMSVPLLSYNVSPSGQARRSRAAYANVAGAQIRQFLLTRDIRWLIGSAVSMAKSLFWSNRP